jgi:SAM-dependent methyltransferase
MSITDPDGEAARSVAAMQRYVVSRQELDKRLAELLAPVLDDGTSVLDAACGIGHLLPIVRELSPACRYVGVDLAEAHVAAGNELAAGDARASFVAGDAERLPELLDERFDVAISWKALMVAEDFAPMLESLMGVTKRHLFVASLFYEGDIDFQIRVTQNDNARRGFGGRTFYNVYSLPRFTAEVERHGGKVAHAERFEIGIDLPRADPNSMGTYTERLPDGRRLQISGALLMPWWILRVDRD